jgi:hypothetical protein
MFGESSSVKAFFESTFDDGNTRTRLVYKVLMFASTDWTEIQMRQLLFGRFVTRRRAFREPRV